MVKVIGVKFKDNGKAYYFNPNDLSVSVGDAVIVETVRGIEYGYVSSSDKEIEEADLVQPLKDVIRIATESDKKQLQQNKQKEKEAFSLCCAKIEKHGLEMKLVDVEYTFDANKIIFYFTADGRVDFRELVKDLASVLRTRIELRQIGIRDEAKMLNGIGICGRGLCCSSYIDSFHPVSIKMAKEQGLSLNPTKISGNCGRLMCCLKYEQDCYEELAKITPSVGSIVATPEGNAAVQSVQMLKGLVKVKLDSDGEGVLKEYPVSQIKILKNAKRKKSENDIDLNELKMLEDN